MPQSSAQEHLSPKDVAPHIYKWSREELEQMQATIAGQLQTIRQSSPSEVKRWQGTDEAADRGPVEWNPF